MTATATASCKGATTSAASCSLDPPGRGYSAVVFEDSPIGQPLRKTESRTAVTRLVEQGRAPLMSRPRLRASQLGHLFAPLWAGVA